MNRFKSFAFSLTFGLLSLSASCQGKLSPISTPGGSNKKDIRSAKADVRLDQIKLAPGFKISVWAADVPNARSMAISENGIVFVGNRQEKNVFSLFDVNC